MTTFVCALQSMLTKVAETHKIVEDQNAEMRHTLTHDHLTGLPNTLQCECVFENVLADPQGACTALHFFYVRFFNLKMVNSTLGFSAGDAVLVCLARRLEQFCSDAISVASVDGHNFAVLYSMETLGMEEVRGKCEAMSRVLEEPIILDDCKIRINVAIGVATYPLDSQNVMETHRNANIAASAVPAGTQPNYRVYEDSLLQRVTERARLEEGILKAIENDEFTPFFQPKLDLVTRKIVGTEALARWISQGKIIEPGKFIPLADETGLIIPITWVMLEKACRENQRFAAAGFHIVVSVNVPVQVILHTDFVQRTLAILEETGMDPHKLEIELTEEAMIADIGKTHDVVEELHLHGIKVSVDDFGTGYSSLQYLKKVPFDTIKIDKVFVEGIPGDRYDEAIIKASVEMAQTLNLKVVVEGVETIPQWEAVTALGCHELQGYIISRPICPDAFIELLHQWNDIT